MIVEAESVQMDSLALGKVEELFWEYINNGSHPGAALAVYRNGKLVLDLYGGIADTDSGKTVAQDTMFVLYSSSKPWAGVCVAILWERGKLAWDDPVAKHWSEFAQNGKAGVTVRHLLTHMGGFPDTPADLTWDKWGDWDAVVRAMEQITPTHEPGAVLAYHGFNYGWVVSELVRRVDGRPFSQFLQEELTGPLGMKDSYVGLPSSLEDRVSRVHYTEDSDIPFLIDTFNKLEVHQAVNPGTCGISTARDLARFYAMMELGGTLDGVQILKPETVREMTNVQVQGMDPTTEPHLLHMGLGMTLADPRSGASREKLMGTFGHVGAGTSVGWGDYDSGLAVAFICNGYRAAGTNNPRLTGFSQAVRDACQSCQ